MRAGLGAALALLFVVAGVAGGAQSGAKGGRRPMAPLNLSIAPLSSDVVSGERLGVRVVVTNPGPQAAVVAGPKSPSEFEFVLRPDDGRAPRTLTAVAARLARTIDPPPPLPRATVTLAPGDSATYEDDLAAYATSPLPPGRYALTVALGAGADRNESPAVALTVVPPAVRALAAVIDRSGASRLVSTFAHATAGGDVVIFQRESRPQLPADGVSHRRATVVAPGPATVAVAVGVELDRQRGGRWFGWQHGDAIGAGIAENVRIFQRVEPVPVGLGAVALHHVGWQPTINDAVFAALGTAADGRVALAAVSVTGRGAHAIATAPLGIASVPAHWAVRWQRGGASPRFDVVWARRSEGRTRVEHQVATPGALAPAVTVTLLDSAEPVVALALDPVDGPGVADVLVGPAADGQLTLLRLPLGGGPPRGRWTAAAPADRDGRRPTAWALGAPAMGDPIALAGLGASLLSWRVAKGDAWTSLPAGAGPASHLTLAPVAGRAWAVWAEPESGLRYAPVP